MEIQITDEYLSQLKTLSKNTGINENEILQRALSIYFQFLKNEIDLKEEIELWEDAGVEDLCKFENGI